MPGQNKKWSAAVKTILMAFCLCLMYHAMIVYDCVMYLTDLFGYWMIKREKNILFSRAYMLHSSFWSLHTIANLVWFGLGLGFGCCDLQQQCGRVILWHKQYFRYGCCLWGVDCTLFRGAILSQTMQSRLPLINPLIDTGIDNSSLCSHWKVASKLLLIRINIIREQDFFKLILLSFIQRRKILLFSRFMSLR